MTHADHLAARLQQLVLALQQGRFAALADLQAEIERLVAQCTDSPAPEAELQSVRMLALRAQTMLAAARQGVQDARQRLQEMESLRRSLRTYQGDGQLRAHVLPGTTCRRA